MIVKILPDSISDFVGEINAVLLYWIWRKNGCAVPPPHLAKQYVINEYRERFSVDILVETGTYKGATIQSQLNNFKKIISIEVADCLYQQAVEKFKKRSHVKLYLGDSGVVLKTILSNLGAPALFWLDGHYSGGVTGRGVLDTPIKAEMETIYESKFRHIVLIDDARLFDGKNGYPELTEFEKWATFGKKYEFVVKDDIIRLTPSHID